MGNRPPTRVGGGGARAVGFYCASGPTCLSELDLSCEAETCRGDPSVGYWSEMQPTGRRLDVLPVWVLTRVLTPACLNLCLNVVNLGLHIVNGVGLSCV
jgi:hypothetical protein